MLHQISGAVDIAGDQSLDDLAMLTRAAIGRMRPAVHGHDQRAARDDFVDIALQQGIAAKRCEMQVEFACQPDCLRIAAAFQRGLPGDHLPQVFSGLGIDAAGQFLDHGALQRGADDEDAPPLVKRRVGDEGAAVRLQFHQTLDGQSAQRLACDRARRAESLADRIFRQAHAGSQLLVEDRQAQQVVDPLGPGQGPLLGDSLLVACHGCRFPLVMDARTRRENGDMAYSDNPIPSQRKGSRNHASRCARPRRERRDCLFEMKGGIIASTSPP